MNRRCLAVVLTLVSAVAWAQERDVRELPLWVQAQLAPKTVPAVASARDPGAAPKSWSDLIDATWGPGRSTAEKLAFFDTFWHAVDTDFACFQGLDVDWRALRDRTRPEVAAGVSKGRFAAIMSRLALALRDAHTNAIDRVVFWRTSTVPGVPLLNVGGWGQITDFGACLTPLDDGTALVYSAPADHPLGLVPGDVVLGYGGRPWRELWPELLDEGLPVTGFWGSTEAGYEHAWLMAVGANWHLFDSIDVRRHATGAIEHMPTAPLVGWRHDRWCTEQLPVAGIGLPDVGHGELVSWGLVDGTRIGYVAVWGWAWDAEQEFRDAVGGLMSGLDTDGLVIDFRFNMGGDMHLSDAGLALLFDRPVPTIDWVTRCVPDDHLGLCAEDIWPSYVIPGDPDTGYHRPIAVLVGPGAVSAGDQVALRMTFHPKTRLFGRPTNGAFNAAALVWDDEEWQATLAVADAFLLSDPGDSLTHEPLPVDHPVWLEPDDVAAGIDTVLAAALRWIEDADRAPRRPSGRVSP